MDKLVYKKQVIILIFVFIKLSALSQINNNLCYTNLPINKSSLIYHQPKHNSPKFKITITTAINKKYIQQIAEEPVSSIDEFDVVQLAKYNLRFRFRLIGKNIFYFGTETASVGYKTNVFYFGFRKYF